MFDPLPLFVELQKKVLDQELSENTISDLVKDIVSVFLKLGLETAFVEVVFTDEQNKIIKSCFVDSELSIISNNVVNIEKIISRIPDWNRSIVQDAILINFPDPVISTQNLVYMSSVKTLVISSIQELSKITGYLVIGNKRDAALIEANELKVAKMFANLVAHMYRLQDTQANLTNVTQEIYKMNAQLHQLDKLKDDFVSIASHELRTPMTAIRSYSWMALYRSDVPLSPKLKKYLERTLISTERLINLVNDMLNISRIESGRIEIVPQVFTIADLVNDSIAEVSAKAVERKIQVKLIPSSMPKVFADPNKVHQVILNLLGNALKFTPVEGVIEVSFFSDGKKVDVNVKDSGVGISKEDLARLFKKFGRLDNSYVAAATSGGTGLGLYICKSLVELMHGKIWATSEGMGKGATFAFSLPIATEENIAAANKFKVKASGEAKGLEPVAI